MFISKSYVENMRSCFENLQTCLNYLKLICTDIDQSNTKDESEFKPASRGCKHSENIIWTVRKVFNELFDISDNDNSRDTILNFKKFDNLIHNRCKSSVIFDKNMDINVIYDMIHDIKPYSLSNSMINYIDDIYFDCTH